MDTEAGDGNVDEAACYFDRKDDRRPWKMMPEEIRVFFMCGYFCEFLLLMPKFFFGNLLFTKKTGVKVQILQNDKKVDVCVEMQTELW